jgi:ABC-2 type transport system ATP-binding protein
MLERVGLTGAEGRLVRQYSLGMRQRLGIGTALLGDPAALVLDEPANGLDPEGIRWMRILLQDFASRGGTVLLSSHLLREVEATADRLVVIGGGRIVAQGTLDELLGGAGVFARGLDDAALGSVLTRAGLEVHPGHDGGWKVVGSTEAVGRAAAASGLILTELRASGTDGLEQLFFDLTSNDSGSENAA